MNSNNLNKKFKLSLIYLGISLIAFLKIFFWEPVTKYMTAMEYVNHQSSRSSKQIIISLVVMLLALRTRHLYYKK